MRQAAMARSNLGRFSFRYFPDRQYCSRRRGFAPHYMEYGEVTQVVILQSLTCFSETIVID